MFQKQQYLQTLRRVPDYIIRVTAKRKLDLYDPNTCICGWVLREALAEMRDVNVRYVSVTDSDVSVPVQCARLFGGTAEEWDAIFSGVMNGSKVPAIEAAFAQRCRET